MRRNANASPAVTRRGITPDGAGGATATRRARTADRPRGARPGRAALGVSIVCLVALAAAPLARALSPARAYEMVSAVDKGNASVRAALPGASPIETWPGGNALVYAAQSPFPGAESAPLFSEMMAKRSPSGWSNRPIDPPQSAPYPGATEAYVTLAVSEDQTYSFVYSWRQLAPGAVEGQSNWYVKDLETGTYEFVATSNEHLAFSNTDAHFWYLGGTPDFSEVEFTVSAKLTPEAVATTNTYLWTRGQGVALISKLPDGSTVPGRTGDNSTWGLGRNQVSVDGKRAFVSMAGAGQGLEGLFVYENGTTRALSTVHIPGEPETPVEANFISATPSGNRVAFMVLEAKPLTPDAHGGGALYVADVETGELTFIAPEVFGAIYGVTDDLSTIYYTSIISGTDHTFVYKDGEHTEIGAWIPGEARTSPNGRYLAFVAPQRLTSYDNTAGPACASGCNEAYRYDSVTGNIVCASCRPDGLPPTGNAEMAQQGGFVLISRHRANVITDTGQMFFDTPDPLVTEDSNGIRDVYEYGEEGPRLISAGTSDSPSTFAEATPDGSDVFFITSQRLVAQDRDNAADMYDARIGGGIPSQNELPTATGCALEQCGALTVAPPAAGIGSEAVPGSSPTKTAKKAARKRKHHHRTHGKKSHRRHNGRNGR